ncbi:extracellular solute-binding protein [Paenibacillus chungangensis]|uniref:Extracellular solute-binding protein n=1 Tax=Paenibacillus chungangensis TaxID=696535 RepID=A0ABW3HVI6_9BACL
MKKGTTLLLAVMLMLAALAGCAGNEGSGGNEGKSGTASGEQAGESTKEPAAAEKPKEPITVQAANLFPNLDPNNPVMQEIGNRAGVKFDLVTVTGDRNQKFDLWLASGDYPKDTLILKPDYISKYKEAGAIIPLEELIEEHGKNIKEKYGEYFDLLKDENGHIYSLYVPNIATEPAPQIQAPFAIRYDVLEAAGYPEVKTLDQLFDVLKAFYDENPTIDGKAMIPFSGFSTSGSGGENLGGPSFNIAGLTNHGRFYIDDSDQARLIYVSDALKQYYQFLNRLYNAGMLDKEFFTLNMDGLTKKITEGRVLAGYFPDWYVQPEVEKTMRASGDTDLMYAYFPLMQDENAKDRSFVSLRTRSNWNWAISDKSEHPEEVIKLLDYMFSDEAQILINWGVEGRHYEVADGKRRVMDSYKQQLKDNPDALWSEHASIFYGTSMYFAHGTKLADGDYATPLTKDSIKEGYDERTNEVLAQYGKQVWSDFLPELEYIPAILSQLGEVEDVRAEMKRVEQIWLKESANMIFAGTSDEFDRLWTNYVQKIDKAGAAKLEEAYTELWRKNTKK